MPKPTPNPIREHRLKMKVGLREMSHKLGTSHVFLLDIENGRRNLPKKRWVTVCKQIPTLTHRILAEHYVQHSPIVLDLMDADPQIQKLGLAVDITPTAKGSNMAHIAITDAKGAR